MSIDLLPMRGADSKEQQLRLHVGSEASFYRGAVESAEMLSRPVRDRYRCPETLLDFALSGAVSSDAGYFRFGPNVTCYGRSCSALCNIPAESLLYDSVEEVVVGDSQLKLPFNPTEIIDNLRLERYPDSGRAESGHEKLQRKLYYLLRPLTNMTVRKQIQKFHARNWEKRPFPRWPVDTTVESICERLLLLSMQAQGVDRVPFVWFWPGGASGCVMMTHDVENEAGRNFCGELMDLDDSFEIKASFQIVPEGRYAVSSEFLEIIRNRGFEIAIQDLNHDGRLFDNRQEFLRRVALINHYATDYAAKGFRSAVLYRKPEWYDSLNFSFDMSIPNVAHLDPQRGGCCTVMPYFVGDILELPVTTIQDYTLFHLLKQRSIDLWKTQIELILEKSGMASFIIHPDYVMGSDTKSVYKALLGHLQNLREERQIWFGLPAEVDSWWRARSKMSVVRHNSSWRIAGEGAERAVLAYATNVEGNLVYELTNAAEAR
jgi:hypothetical protein